MAPAPDWLATQEADAVEENAGDIGQPPSPSHDSLDSIPLDESPFGDSIEVDVTDGEENGNGPVDHGSGDRFPPPDMSAGPLAPPSEESLAFPPPPAFGEFGEQSNPLEGPSFSRTSEASQGDIPGLLPEGATSDDPFAGIDIDAPSEQSEHYHGGDLGGPSLSADGALEPGAGQASPFAKIALNKVSANEVIPRGGSQAATVAAVAAYIPPTQSPTPKKSQFPPKEIGRWPTGLGLILGGALAFLGLTEQGRALVPQGGALFALLQGDQPLSGGLREVKLEGAYLRPYKRKGGELLLLAGRVRNLSKSELEGVRAVALVLEGDQVVQRKEAPLGRVLNEAQLSRIEKEAVEEFASLPPLVLEPGKHADFMIIFFEAPPEAEKKRFRVEFLKQNARASW